MNLQYLKNLAFLNRLKSFKIPTKKVLLSLFGTTIAAGFVYPQTRAKFELYFQETEENMRRLALCPSIQERLFFPTPYLAYGILQAIYAGHSVHCDPNIQFTPEIIDLPDGGKVGIHWSTHIEPKGLEQRKAVMIVLPGLTASAKEPYVKNLVSEALDHGYEVAVYHNRGNEVEFVYPKTGFYDPIHDFKIAVDHVRAKYPDHDIFAVGHSFGANTLVNYLGKYKEQHHIKGAASIANPFDFVKAAQGILNTYFDKYLAQSLQAWADRNKHILSLAPGHVDIDLDKAMSVTSMISFDEYLTRRIQGYKNFLEYYEDISSARKLKDVNIPLLCMHSRDDPFLHESSIPVQESSQNSKVTLLVTNCGGHVGWFHGFLQPKRWFPKPTLEFINACHSELIQSK